MYKNEYVNFIIHQIYFSIMVNSGRAFKNPFLANVNVILAS